MVPALARLAPDSLSAALTHPDWRVFAFTALAGILAGVLFGIAPAFHAMRVDVNHVLKEGGRSAVQSGHPRLRNALVVAQISIALVLLAGAGLLTRSLYNLMNESPGFRTAGILAVKVSLTGGSGDLGRFATRLGELRERVAALPGVQSVASTSFTPFSGGNSSANIIPEGYVIPADGSVPAAEYRTVAPEYFVTMGIPILRGRVFTKADGIMPGISIKEVYQWFATAEYQVVVNQEMARRFWPGQDPVGRRFRFGPPSMKGALMTVAGLCGDTRLQALDRPPEPMFYISSWMYPWPENTILIQTAGLPQSLTSAVRKTILAQEPGAVVSEPSTLEGALSETTSARRSNLRLMTAFAGLALVLAMLGIYGVIAYSVGQRRQEFGVRMALGATPALLVRSVLGLGARLALIGVAIGIAASVWLARLISAMLYGVSPTDPFTLAAVAALLLAGSLAASALPAARATRVDPSEALRAE
jgi:putative ABC transport system permease protein